MADMTIPCPHNGVHEPGREPIYCLRQKLDQAEAALARVVDAATSAKDYLKPELDEPGRSVFWGLVGALKEARTPTLSRAADRIRADGWREAALKVQDICSEFGDDPKACLGILGEHFGAVSRAPGGEE